MRSASVPDAASCEACSRALAGIGAEPALEVPQSTRRAAVTLPMAGQAVTAATRAGVRAGGDIGALYRRYHDRALQLRWQPEGNRARALYAVLEEVRLEHLGGRCYAGVAGNLDHRWQRRASDLAGAQQAPANSPWPWPPGVQAALDLVRRRLLDRPAVDDDAASTPAGVPLELLLRLHAERTQQSRFAPLAALLASALVAQWRVTEGELRGVDDQTGSPDDDESGSPDRQPFGNEEVDAAATTTPVSAVADNPEGDEADDGGMTDDASASLALQGGAAPDAASEQMAGDEAAWVQGDAVAGGTAAMAYRVYTRDFDETLASVDLGSTAERRDCRLRLDRYLAGQSRVIERLARKLYRTLMARQRRHWEFDQPEGVLDTARLTRLITQPSAALSFKVDADAPAPDTVICLLIDNSRSMLGKPILMAASAADILARTLEKCSVAVEILGFTTASMDGGRVGARWADAGRPAAPGRLNAVRHIVYKRAGQSWRSARQAISLMLDSSLLNQNIDGEALVWASERLLRRAESRKILVVITDGVPVDVSTLSANGDLYLASHLRSVIEGIERDARIELMAIGIGNDVGDYYNHAISVHDPRQLGRTMISELAGLFEAARGAGGR